MLIPTITPAAINATELDDLMRIGFCYVKIPDNNLIKTIQTAIHIARDFFQTSPDEKQKWALKETLQAGDKYQGYVLRSQSKNTNSIEQIFFEPDAPFGPYQSHAPLIHTIDHSFMDGIVLPILQAIYNKLSLTPANFMEATTKPTCSLVFQLFTALAGQKDVVRLNAHKDFGLITVLYYDEPGLEVKYENAWHVIPPQKDCVVVNLGNATELMTGQRCHSAVHRVRNASDTRISMVYFVNPNYQQAVRNYSDNSVIADNGEQFFKQQFAEYFEVDH